MAIESLQDSCQTGRKNFAGQNKNLPVLSDSPAVFAKTELGFLSSVGAGLGHCGESSKHPRKFRVGTLNVNTQSGRVYEVVETLSHRKVDVYCIQETLYRGGNRCTIKCKDTRYKLPWSGNDKGSAGVGVFVVEEWLGKVFEVQRVSDRIILVKLIVGQHVDTILFVNAQQSGLVINKVKDLFQLGAVTARIPGFEFLNP